MMEDVSGSGTQTQRLYKQADKAFLLKMRGNFAHIKDLRRYKNRDLLR